ncbi:MAG: hypothetical protein WDZ80_00495 [Candidatus Paceibacterota bacterium]
MDFNEIDDLKKFGFTGFKKIQDLWIDSSVIPDSIGVYVIWNPFYDQAEFINPGVGGFFKGKDPNVDEEVLLQNFNPESKVVYIGKAGSLNSGSATLKSRLRQYLRFGQSKKAGHWGGRYIWQLKHHKNLMIAWRRTPTQDPRNVEIELLNMYRNQFGQLPFANLTN